MPPFIRSPPFPLPSPGGGLLAAEGSLYLVASIDPVSVARGGVLYGRARLRAGGRRPHRAAVPNGSTGQKRSKLSG